MDVKRWQSWGSDPPRGGVGPACPICQVPIWIELGGGAAADVYRPNVDFQKHPNVDIVLDLETSGLPFHDNHADRIKAIHLWEHLSHAGALWMAKESLRVLKPGGTLYLMLSDGEFVIDRIKEEGLGGQSLVNLFHSEAPDEQGFHKWAWSYESLRADLTNVGFVHIIHRGFYNRWEFKCEAFKPW